MSSKIRVQRICQYCEKEFTAKTTVTKYCSHKCNQKAYKASLKAKRIENSYEETIKFKILSIEKVKAKEFLTVKETAILLNCSTRTVYRMIKSRTIKAVNLAKRMTRIRREELNTIMKNSSI